MQEPKEISRYDTLRLVLGDQLNPLHSWFTVTDNTVLYVLMEVRSETDYAWHHIQKATAFFAAMENFANALEDAGHKVTYIKLDAPSNLQSFGANCQQLIEQHHIKSFGYQLPDEYRVDQLLQAFCESLDIAWEATDTHHFYTSRTELQDFFAGKKMLLMENFYHYMRRKHNILMKGSEPHGGKWNFDTENRKKLPRNHIPPPPLFFSNDVTAAYERIRKAGVYSIGTINPKALAWPVNREQSLELLEHFTTHLLPLFGTFQDAMDTNHWSLYHSRLSFSMNTKMLSPKEVVDKAIDVWEKTPAALP